MKKPRYFLPLLLVLAIVYTFISFATKAKPNLHAYFAYDVVVPNSQIQPSIPILF